MYTLDTVKEAKSYEALKRNSFTDEQIVKYYNMTSASNRKIFFQQVMSGNLAPTPSRDKPKAKFATVGTLPSKSFLEQVKVMATIKMNTTFIYEGLQFNAIEENYKLVFTNNKRTFGRHCISRRNAWADTKKTIELSKWIIENSKEDNMDLWVDTILHEIAHAIDYKLRGKSDHQWQWKQIAMTVGCAPKASASNDEIVGTSKYTISCPKCGHQRNGHKFSAKVARGHKSCGKCGNGYFDKEKTLIQTQNY